MANTAYSSTTGGIPVAPSLAPSLESAQVPVHSPSVDIRVVQISAAAVSVAVLVALVAQGLTHLIYFFTNLCFFGRFSFSHAVPYEHMLGLFVILVPVGGALVIGLMARFGLESIRGDGIPEAMENVLLHQSTIPPLMTLLKPISAAISIGTGGPFGAEGPIIASGGALGSLVGQIFRITASERKTLLAAGAGAGIAAAFGSPVAAVLLAVEILLFELRPQSLIPVALASAVAAGIRTLFEGVEPIFNMPDVAAVSISGLFIYCLIGAFLGVAAALVTRSVFYMEEAFDHLPMHWMWWPAIGAVFVGVIGWFMPRTLGAGYMNITDLLANNLSLKFVLVLSVLKFVSWTISLSSGTSGGTLAPLFTIGGGIGVLLATLSNSVFAGSVDLRMAALVGMAAMFAGTSRAVLASVVFAVESTHQVNALGPVLGGCFTSYLISCLMMQHSIMAEKIARRGVRVPTEYTADILDQIPVEEVMSRRVVSVKSDDTVAHVLSWLNSGVQGSTHQGFAVFNSNGTLAGVVTRKDLTGPAALPAKKILSLLRRPAVVVYADCSLKAAADHMVNHDIGRLPVVLRAEPSKVVGFLTRSDILSARRKHLDEHLRRDPKINLGFRVLAHSGTPG